MHSTVVFDDKLWVMGGGIYHTAHPFNTVRDYSDVWRSEDGVHWTQATDAAGWTARRFHSSVVYQNRMWVIAGYHRGNRNDVWCSHDGVHWREVTSDSLWPIRHEPSCLVFQDRLWLLGGYGDQLYDDVWAGRLLER